MTNGLQVIRMRKVIRTLIIGLLVMSQFVSFAVELLPLNGYATETSTITSESRSLESTADSSAETASSTSADTDNSETAETDSTESSQASLAKPTQRKKAKAAAPLIIDLADCPYDLSGWPVVSATASLEQTEGQWTEVSQDPTKPTIIPDFKGDKSIKLKYKVDMEAFFKTEAGKWLQEKLDAREKDQEVFFDFSYTLSKDIHMINDVKNQEMLAGDNSKIGTFDIIKGGAPNGDHLWKVRMNSNTLLSGNGWANMEFGSYITLTETEEEKSIVISGEDRAEVEIFLEKEPPPYSLAKNASGKEPKAVKIGDQVHYLLEWEVIVDLKKDKINQLENLKLYDKDITKFFAGSDQTHGFYFPSPAEYDLIAENGFTVLDVKVGGETWVQGKDYKFGKYDLDAGSSEMIFNRPVQDQVKVTFTTISKDKHPTGITNQVTATTDGQTSLTDTATQNIYRHNIEKESINKGSGIVQWQIIYHRDHENEEVFFDELESGVIQQGTFRVVDEYGKEGLALAQGEDYQVSFTAENKFQVTFREGLPKGRYIIYYESKHPADQPVAGLQNHFHNDQVGDTAVVSDNKITVTKDVKTQPDDDGNNRDFGFRDKTILWKSTIETIAEFGPIQIRDAAVIQNGGPVNGSHGLIYRYDDSVTDSQLTFDAKGEPSIESIKKRGIIVTYVDGNGKAVLIPMQDLEVTMKHVTLNDDGTVNKEEGAESLGDAWVEKFPGFYMTVHQKYAGKKLHVYVASQYGNNAEDELPIIPLKSDNGYFVNTIEAKQSVGEREFYGKDSANTNHSQKDLATDIHKKGQFIPAFSVDPVTGTKTELQDEYMVQYHGVMNANLFYLSSEDSFMDHLSAYNVGGTEMNANQQVHYFDPQDISQMEFYKMVLKPVGSPIDPNENTLFQKYEKVPLEPDEYELIWLKPFSSGTYKGMYKSFQIKLKKDLGNTAIGMVVYTRMHKDNIALNAVTSSHGEIKFRNGIKQTINGQNKSASASPSLTFKNNSEVLDKQSHLIYEDDDPSKPVKRVGYTLTVNSQKAVYENLEVEDIPNGQIIDYSSLKVVIGKNQFANNVIETVVDETKEPLILDEHYTLEKSGSGFKLKLLGSAFASGKVDFPVLITYETIPTTTHVTNTASYQHSSTVTVTDKSEQRIQIASGEGGFNFNTIQLTKLDFETKKERLQGATFDLERWNEASKDYRVIKTKTTDLFGDLYFDGMAPGKYRIRETKAPLGYMKFGRYVYFELTETGTLKDDQLVDETGKPNAELDSYYEISKEQQAVGFYLFFSGNKEAPFQLDASKVLRPLEKLTESKTFDFEIQEVATGKKVAIGRTVIKPEHQQGSELVYQEKVTFYPVDAKGDPGTEAITDWTEVLQDKTAYRLVEVAADGYQVAYQEGAEATSETPHTFTTDFSADQGKITLNYTVTNEEQPPRTDFVMPDAGGWPTYLSLLVGIGFVLVGIYYYRDPKKVDPKR